MSNVNGSANSITSSASSSPGVQRANSSGSSSAATHVELTITKGRTSTPGSDAAITLRAGLVSTSCWLEMTPWALAPTRQPGLSVSRRICVRSATLPT